MEVLCLKEKNKGEERGREIKRKKRRVSAYLSPCWARLARAPEQASSCHIHRSWGLASALLCQRDFQSQSPELWDSRESSWASCCVCGVKNKPLAKGTGCRLAMSPAPSSVELLSTLISFCDSATPPVYKLLHPSALLAPPIAGSLFFVMSCHSWLIRLLPNQRLLLARPLTDLVLSLPFPFLWSSRSWISHPCCLIPLLV